MKFLVFTVHDHRTPPSSDTPCFLVQNNPGKCGERKGGVSDLGDSGKAIPTFLTCRRSQVDSALGLEGWDGLFRAPLVAF